MFPPSLPAPPEPLQTGLLDVGQGHRLYFETGGNPRGLPVLVLHGGPGSGASPRLRGLYDPQRFHTVLFDQRGAGRSQPAGELRNNDTAALLADIERLRRHLGIERWLVSGGSWGASLAVAYAAAQRPATLGVLVRSVFLTGERDVRWFFQTAARRFPVAWADLAAPFPPEERGELLAALQRRLHADCATARAAAIAWTRYERCLSSGDDCPAPADPALADNPSALDQLVAKYRLQAHYLARQCFLGEARLLDLAGSLGDLPVAILHGRRDWICRPRNACQLQHRIAGSRLQWIGGCGHDPFHPAMVDAWQEALRRFVAHGDFRGVGRTRQAAD